MKKNFLYRWFGIGKIPLKIKITFESEGILLLEEGISGWFIAKDVKAPAKRYRNRSEGFVGWFVITEKRIVLYSFSKRQINISTNDPKLKHIYAKILAKDNMSISFESSFFRDRWNGVIEFQLHMEKGREFHKQLLSFGINDGFAENKF